MAAAYERFVFLAALSCFVLICGPLWGFFALGSSPGDASGSAALLLEAAAFAEAASAGAGVAGAAAAAVAGLAARAARAARAAGLAAGAAGAAVAVAAAAAAAPSCAQVTS